MLRNDQLQWDNAIKMHFVQKGTKKMYVLDGPPADPALHHRGKGGGKSAAPQGGKPGKGGGKGTYGEAGGWPKGTPYYNSGPWVPCQNPKCKGHNGKPSFKYINSIGVGVNGDYCMGCGQGWKKSLQQAKAKGIFPGYEGEEENKGDDFTENLAASPFAGDDAEAAVGSSPFQPIQKEALELCPKRFHHLLRQHLFGGGIDDFMLQAIEGQIKEGMEDAKKLSEAMAIGMAAKGPAVAPMPPTPPQATEAGKTLEQQQKEAKAAWHATREVLQQKEKAFQAGTRDFKWFQDKAEKMRADLLDLEGKEKKAGEALEPLKQEWQAAMQKESEAKTAHQFLLAAQPVPKPEKKRSPPFGQGGG